MDNSIVNKVAQSGLITLDLEKYKPDHGQIARLDLADFFFQRLIVKEKEFRYQIKNTNWETFTGKEVAVFCSVDAIIPYWAYMLITASLQPYAKRIEFMPPDDLHRLVWKENVETGIRQLSLFDRRVIVKGCGEGQTPADIFVAATKMLIPQVKSLMYGEPCSTVPIYKKGN